MYRGQSPSFLICDHDYLSGQLIGFEVEKHLGATYDLADDVETAIRGLKKQHYDLLITEIYLPGKTGMELVQYVKNNHPDLPVIVLSADLSDDELLLFHDLKAEDFVRKPFNMVELKIRILRVLNQRMAS